jgi:hypothetical protein
VNFPPSDSLPSIFLIVLDKFTGRHSLAKNYGYDLGPFENALRERGFIVPESTRSNYPHTTFSLASMLNWAFINELVGTTPEDQWRRIAAEAVEDSRLRRFLRELGYEFVFISSTYWLTRHNRFADRVLPEGQSLRDDRLGARYLASTPLLSVIRRYLMRDDRSQFPYPVESAADLEHKFEIIADLASENGGLFVFAHVLSPHEPYVYYQDCSHREPYWPPTDRTEDDSHIRQLYTEQIRCLSHHIISMVDLIISESARPPIILLQSDHGHGRITIDPLIGAHLPLTALEIEQVEERLEVFSAYHLPGPTAGLIPDTITSINLLPIVLNHYFEADIEHRPNYVHWMDFNPPHRITRVE